MSKDVFREIYEFLGSSSPEPRSPEPAGQGEAEVLQPLDFAVGLAPPPAIDQASLAQLQQIEALTQEMYTSENRERRAAAEDTLTKTVMATDPLIKCQIFLKLSQSHYLLVNSSYTHAPIINLLCFFSHSSLHCLHWINCLEEIGKRSPNNKESTQVKN